MHCYIDLNWPVADCFLNETIEHWMARGAPTKRQKWFIWVEAGPGEFEALAGPFDTLAQALKVAEKNPHWNVLISYPEVRREK